MAFTSNSDELSASGSLLGSSAAIGGIIFALLLIAPELSVPIAVVGLLKVASGASLVATVWSLSEMFSKQGKTWSDDWRIPYGALAVSLILFILAFVLIQFPGLSAKISEGFAVPPN